MPPVVISHTFYASQDDLRNPDFFRMALTNSKVFCAVYGYAGKEDLRKGYKTPKRKLRVTTHFSEIIKLEFEKKNSTFLYIFLELLSLAYLWKVHGYP